MPRRGLTSRHPTTDQVLVDIAKYATRARVGGAAAYRTARYCLMDALGCALEALSYPACTKLLGPVVPGAGVRRGARVPGTRYELDPVTAAFNLGCMIRWLDFNDTWLAAEWAHPSDNLGGILTAADYFSRQRAARRQPPLVMRNVLTALIQAYEIQGIMGLKNSLNRVGLDHVALVRVASTAVVTRLLGGSLPQIINAVSNAFVDGGSLRVYRHAPNTGSRKSWAAGDATSRAVRLALMALAGEMGYPTVLTTRPWGFYDVLFKGRPFVFPRRYGSYVIENVLFKVAFPAEFHAQTAAEAAIALHPAVAPRLGEVARVVITTQESAVRIIDKTGPLKNPADRDHSIQYIVAVGLIKGSLTAADYEDEAARDPRIDELRGKMAVVENRQYSRDYLDPAKRSIANAVQVFFRDGRQTARVAVEYPIGHRRRRRAAWPLLVEKFRINLDRRFAPRRRDRILRLCLDAERLDGTPVPAFVEAFVP